MNNLFTTTTQAADTSREKRNIDASPRPWSVERWKGKHGDAGISIKDANGVFIANMVFQAADNEMANARLLVDAVNAEFVKGDSK